MNVLSEKEQDSLLSKSLKKIKEQTYFINNTISQNKLRQCLQESYILLNELRINNLTPRRYYNLYISVFDVMLNIKNYMSEEVSRGRILIDLYDKVQQAKYVIPRIYLMITVGSIYMEKVPKSVHVILFDLLGVVKQVQNPVKGLFIRNYLLKMIKDKLPDKDNIYEKEGGTFEDSLKFLIQNMEEMNLLWVRLLIGVDGNDKKQREKEREELKILIGESINKLSSLESLTKEIYEEQILTKLLKIILDSKDVLCQQYLIECILHSFPNNYNIKCIEQILETMTKLEDGVDICELFINMMDKIGNYFGDNTDKNDLNDILETAKNVYPALLENFEVIINTYINKEEKNEDINNKKNDINKMPLSKLLELINSFLKFSLKCSPEEQKNNSVDKIISYISTLIKKYNDEIKEEENKKIYEIFLIPIEAGLNIYNINEYFKLFELVDYTTKKNIAIELINHLVNNINDKSTQKLDSLENYQKIIRYIQPLISDNNNKKEDEHINDQDIIQEEQNIVCKLLYIINSPDPEVIHEIFNQFKNIFSYGGQVRRKFSLPCLVNAIIIFCHKLTICYENKISQLPKDIKINKKTLNQIVNSLNISKITDNEFFYKLMLNNYKLLNEAINLIAQENTEIAYKLYIYGASLVNEIIIEKEKFSESCLSFINKALDLLEFDPKLNKIGLIKYLSSNIIYYNILNNEQKEKLINKFIKIHEDMQSREEQFKLILIICQLYYSIFKDGKKVLECLNKARRYADFDMTISKNVCLYVDLLNKMIYFVEKGDNIVEIKKEQIEDLIELIKGHINTMKNTDNENDKKYINDVEKYFLNIINTLKKGKNHKDEKMKEFYQKINL